MLPQPHEIAHRAGEENGIFAFRADAKADQLPFRSDTQEIDSGSSTEKVLRDDPNGRGKAGTLMPQSTA